MLKKMLAVFAVLLLIGGIFMVLPGEVDKGKDHTPTVELAFSYIIVAEAPETEEERIISAGISSLAFGGEPGAPTYSPIYFVDSNGLDDHSLWTLEHFESVNVPVYVFAKSSGLAGKVENQLSSLEVTEVIEFEYTKDALMDFKGFDGYISVASYREALWVSPLAQLENKVIVPGSTSFMAQEDVWNALYSMGFLADYVIVANPDDWMDFYTVFDGVNTSYHIPDLALVTPELAMFRTGYVITDVDVPKTAPPQFADMVPPEEPEINLWQMGLLMLLRNMSKDYGPISSIALVGSAEAVPQFELPDYSTSEPDYTSSDSVYGFLDDDDLDMDAGVGRLVNFNLQGMCNQLVKTFLYDSLVQTVTVTYENGEDVTTTWRSHAVDANGFEVADMRGQNTPGLFASRDYDDEGYTFDYISTIGVGTHGGPTLMQADFDVEGYVQSASHLLYRGHGSWHGTLYTWGYYSPIGGYGERMIEGDAARDLFIPPQVTLLFSCENTKIHGLSYGGDPIEMDRVFATSWMYAGAVALIGATEVSYSNIGQDIYGLSGEVTGDHNWDLNNLWFASTAKYTLDEEYNMGEVMRRSENRYLDKHPGITPLKEPENPSDDGAHWKEVAMYALYGDPAFQYHVTSPGENDYMPWD